MSTVSSQSKFYQTNKDKVLAYKKQYYQEKNKAYIALKKIHINCFSKRDSDKLIKVAVDNNNIEICINDKHYSLEDFLKKYSIENNCKVIGYVENDSGGYNCSDNDIDFNITCVSSNHKLILQIILPIIEK